MRLPVDDVLPELKEALQTSDAVVLEAPPGAGKTTRVPVALLSAKAVADERPLISGKILVLEPRRIAARSAAERMAALLQENTGQTVGYRIRGESRVSAQTRIEVITEGILIRMLQTDPALEGVGLVIFDEFHERNIDSDLGLALSLYAREIFREPQAPLKLLVMSATLDGQSVAQLLDGAPVISSAGRQYPVDINYLNNKPDTQAMERNMAMAIQTAIKTHQQGDVLAFLPGKKEISRTQELLTDLELDQHADVYPLYGDLPLAQQRLAIAPAANTKRKIVLATSIAESSLTIEGVRIVIDSGYSRLPAFDPNTAMTRLTTRLSSKASATQRAGRAGRLAAGVCYRLWSEAQHDTRPAFTSAEILQADLTPLVLTLYRFGADNTDELRWLDSPPPGAFSQAKTLLHQLGALAVNSNDNSHSLTSYGELLSEFAVHPRLAHMLLTSHQFGVFNTACALAAILSSGDPIRNAGADIALRLHEINSNKHKHRHIVQLRNQLKEIQTKPQGLIKTQSLPLDTVPGLLLASAYPDRIAKRKPTGEYQLANGRMARLRADDPLNASEWLAIAHTGSASNTATDNIYLAAVLDAHLFENELSSLLEVTTQVQWPANEKALKAETQTRLGRIVLHAEAANHSDPAHYVAEVISFIRRRGLHVLPWNDAARQLRDRLQFVRLELISSDQRDDWPDVSDDGLTATLEQWLAPYLNNISHINHFAALDMKAIIEGLLPWERKQQLDSLAPTHYQVPSGSNIRIDYSTQSPILGVKLQEMLGADTHPSIGHGYPLKVSLMSPAMRQIQLTQDLPGFWHGSYDQVKKEMKARYPKHFWPDHPAQATASSRTIKPRK